MLSSTLTISHESYCFARNIFPLSESRKDTAALETKQDPSYPLLPSSPAFSLSQHQGLFQWWFFQSGGQSYWSFSFSVSPSISVLSWFPLGLIDFIFLLSKGLKRVFSSTTVWEKQFFGPQHSHLCSFHDGSEGKESACNAGDPGSIPQSERHSGEGNGNPRWNLAGEAHGQRSLVGYNPWGHRESDRTEELTLSLPFSHILTWLVEEQVWLYGPLLTKRWLYFLICPLVCRQESLRRNWGERRVQNEVLGCNLKNDWMISLCFQGKPFNIAVIQVYAPNQ